MIASIIKRNGIKITQAKGTWNALAEMRIRFSDYNFRVDYVQATT